MNFQSVVSVNLGSDAGISLSSLAKIKLKKNVYNKKFNTGGFHFGGNFVDSLQPN